MFDFVSQEVAAAKHFGSQATTHVEGEEEGVIMVQSDCNLLEFDWIHENKPWLRSCAVPLITQVSHFFPCCSSLRRSSSRVTEI